jgi:acetyl-CoA carboxylase biotin carboxyl carrier protein
MKGRTKVAIYNVKSEVTGAVWKIVATVGQKLEPGDTVMIVESMKMEIPVIAEDGGTVKEVLVAEGNPVTEGQPVAALET